jgi:hypothetical protein
LSRSSSRPPGNRGKAASTPRSHPRACPEALSSAAGTGNADGNKILGSSPKMNPQVLLRMEADPQVRVPREGGDPVSARRADPQPACTPHTNQTPDFAGDAGKVPPSYPPNLHTGRSTRLQQFQQLAPLIPRFRDIPILHSGSREILPASISQDGSRSLFNGAGSMQMSVKSSCKPDRCVTRTGVGRRRRLPVRGLPADLRRPSRWPQTKDRRDTPHAQAPPLPLPAHICR